MTSKSKGGRTCDLSHVEELAERLKGAARDRDESVNAYAVKVLSAAVDPDLAGDEITGLRERLARAGLLLTPEHLSAKRPSARALSRARAAAGRGAGFLLLPEAN